jgi:hypothetical protein
MKISGSKQQMYIGGWLLAALVLLGLNASRFMSLEQQPLVGYSQTVKSLQSQLRAFDKMAATGVFAVKERFDLLKVGARLSTGGKTAASSGSARAKSSGSIPDAAASVLPTLSGIMQAMDPSGGVDYRAVLNGRVCRVRDKIDEFTVVKISSAAVVVRRAGRSWTLESPAPYFSSDQGS